MKHSIFLIIFLIAIGFLGLSSCNSVMDTKPQDTYTSDAVWENYSLAEGYIYTCYSNIIPGYMISWDHDILTKDMLNQDWGGTYVSEKTEQMDVYSDEGWNNFSNIRSVNLALEKLKASPFTELQLNTLSGEAYFLRSIIYFAEAKKFGGVQIVRRVLSQDDNFNIDRSTLKETYDFILSDLDSAALLLPETNERGRASKGAAYAMTMRVALQAGAYLNDDNYYEKVISAGDKLFELNQYTLDDYSNLFNSYEAAISSSENILVYERLSTNTAFQDTPIEYLIPNGDNTSSKLTTVAMELYPFEESFEGWCNYTPTQDLVDDYLVTDADGKEKVWDQTSYLSTGKNVNEKMYQNRDERFYASIVYDSTKFFNNMVYTRENGNLSTSISPLNGGNISGGGTSTGYTFRKYVYEDTKVWYSDPTNFCYSVLRLGEACLNYAEAAYMLGDENTARTYITKTYQKHGGFSNSITSDSEDLWIAYKRERNVEMILECGDRYYSLLRWGMQITGGLVDGYESSGYSIPELNGQMTGIAIDSEGKSYQIFNLNEKNGLPLTFTPKRYLFPVPYSEIQANSELNQNPGWQ